MTIDNVTERNGENIGESHRLGANNRGTRGRVVMRWNCAVDDTVPLFLLLLLSHRRENVRSVKTVYSKATNNIGARKGDNREFDPKPRDYNQPSLSLSVKFSIRFDNSTRRVQRGRFDNYPLCSKTRLDSIRSTPPLLPPSGIEPIPRWCIRARISLIDSIPRRAEFQSRTGETVSTLAFGNYV